MEQQYTQFSRKLRGVVVANNDPLKQGRVQVRIPELHGFKQNKTQNNYELYNGENNQEQAIEDKNLPWAEVLMPIDFIGFHKAPQDGKEIYSEKLNGVNESKTKYRDISREGDKRGGFGKNVKLIPGTFVWVELLGGDSNNLLVVGTYAAQGEFSQLTSDTDDTPANSFVYDSITGHYQTFDDDTGNIIMHNRSGTQFKWDSQGNEFNDVVKDKKTSVQGNETYHINGTSNLRVGGNVDESLEANRHTKIKSNDTREIEGNESVKINGTGDRTVQGNQTENYNSNYTRKVGGSENTSVSGSRTTSTSGTHRITASVIYLN